MLNNSKNVSICQYLQPTVMTMNTAGHLIKIGMERLSIGRCEVDLSHLSAFDSTALAILLAWRRVAFVSKTTLLISSMPEKLAKLADMYGVEKILV